MNFFRIIKINILALIALPLLLIATVVKLVAKALEKTITIIGTCLILLGIALLFEIGKNPSGFFDNLFFIIVLLVIGGIFTALIVWVLALVSATVMGMVAFVIGVINAVYELVYAGYAGLYHICYEDYCMLNMSKNAKRGSCFIYNMLRVLNRIIIFFATHALKLLFVLCVVVVGYCIVSTNSYIKSIFGMNVITFLKMFQAYEVIMGVVLFLAFLIGFVTVVMSLGIEWSEWGEEMSLSTSDYEKYIKNIQKEYTGMSGEHLVSAKGGDAKRLDKYNRYIEIMNYHIRNTDDFLQNILPIAEKSEDHVLRANSGQYVTEFYEITEHLYKFEGQIPIEELEKLMPRIDQMDALLKKIEQQVQQIRESQEKKVVAGFFSGCDTPEKLEKRYKALCKTYHPDSEAGDEETFKLMQDEYESRKKELSAR